MRLVTIAGILFAALWPLQGAATVVSPDMGADWMQALDTDASYKRGRDESSLRARGRAGPVTATETQPGGWIPAARTLTQASPKHQGKSQETQGPVTAGGKHGPQKALAWIEPERKGLSLVGQIQMVSAPRSHAAPPRAQVGPIPLFEGGLAIMIALTMVAAGYRAAARDARKEKAFKRGPHTRAAQMPYVRGG
jgi:hypothetical protein